MANENNMVKSLAEGFAELAQSVTEKRTGTESKPANGLRPDLSDDAMRKRLLRSMEGVAGKLD